MKRFKKLIGKEDGFTIIEVVLVLAIAGLIFLVVFLALPQLQRSRRDTQRRNDAGRVLAALENYSSNQNGNYPAATSGDTTGEFGGYGDSDSFWGQYIETGSSEMQDPSIGDYNITFGNSLAGNAGDMDYEVGEDCEGNLASRNISIRVGLEEGEYCQDNR